MDIYGYIWVYFYPCMPIYTHIYPIYPNILSYTFKAYSFYVETLDYFLKLLDSLDLRNYAQILYLFFGGGSFFI
jgi:hypothetical protein